MAWGSSGVAAGRAALAVCCLAAAQAGAHAGAQAGTSREAAPRRPARPVIGMCQPYEHMHVSNRLGERFIVRNDNYGHRRECLTNSGHAPGFVVSESAAHSHHQPGAFPYIFLGCSWGLCTPGSGLPARVAGLPGPRSTWITSQHAPGNWDAAYDIWFSKAPITTGQATGPELMIWLNWRPHGRPRRARVVHVGQVRWYLTSWITHHAGHRWRLTEFRRVKPVWRVRGLRLRPFFRKLERRGWIRPWYWLLNIEAGFEIWHGGTGLATRWFSARP